MNSHKSRVSYSKKLFISQKRVYWNNLSRRKGAQNSEMHRIFLFLRTKVISVEKKGVEFSGYKNIKSGEAAN